MTTQVFGLDALGGVPAAINNLVEDTSPQFGAAMDMNGFNLLSLTATGPSILDEAASATNPTLIPRQDAPTTGIGAVTAFNVNVICDGTDSFQFGNAQNSCQLPLSVTGFVQTANSNGPQMLNEASSSTNPTVIPDRAVPTSGLGGTGNEWSLIRLGSEQLSGGAGFIQSQVAINMGVNNLNNIASVLSQNAGGYSLLNELASATNPTVIPNRASGTTGLGGVSGAASLIAGSVERISVNATGIGFFATAPVARPTGVTVDAAGIHAALVTLGLITA